MKLICPICGNELNQMSKSYCCENQHSFDIARQGYVNLLTVQQKHSLVPGDTREQVLSRRKNQKNLKNKKNQRQKFRFRI